MVNCGMSLPFSQAPHAVDGVSKSSSDEGRMPHTDYIWINGLAVTSISVGDETL